ncbi:MAG: ABC transporter ATP-binding protein [Proteobacteria bacterium]|nr:ABC transporter ATP-binding protein [Pseudomonadota bacterium]
MKPILEITELTKSYGRLTAVDALSMTIKPGEAVAFIGQNGAGKSTTMRAVAGLASIDTGSIRICGHDIASEPVEARQHFGYVSQDLDLYNYLTGEEFLMLVAQIRGCAPGDSESEIQALLELCDLNDARKRLIREYSGGMARKIAMAGALVGSPDLVILDESFVGLDPESTYRIGKFLKSYVAQGRAILISSHILDMLHAMCNRFFILHHGRCVADYSLNELDELCHSPETPDITAVYLQKTGQAGLIRADKAF